MKAPLLFSFIGTALFWVFVLIPYAPTRPPLQWPHVPTMAEELEQATAAGADQDDLSAIFERHGRTPAEAAAYFAQ
jgi:hypothetical protein